MSLLRAWVLCGSSRTHIPTFGGLGQAAPFTRCDRRCGGFKDDRCKRRIDLITCDGRVYTCILFRAVCLAYIDIHQNFCCIKMHTSYTHGPRFLYTRFSIHHFIQRHTSGSPSSECIRVYAVYAVYCIRTPLHSARGLSTTAPPLIGTSRGTASRLGGRVRDSVCSFDCRVQSGLVPFH